MRPEGSTGGDARVPGPGPGESPITRDRFVYDEANDGYRCPEGQLLRFTRIKRTRNTMMRLYRGAGALCRACPAFGVCTTDRRHGRSLEIGPHDALLRRHRAWMRTDEAKGVYRRRMPLVEVSLRHHQRAAASPQVLCCAAYATWRLSGRCSPRPSTCALYGGYGEPLRLPRQGVGPSREHPQPIGGCRPAITGPANALLLFLWLQLQPVWPTPRPYHQTPACF